MKATTSFNLTVTETASRCPIGEAIGQRNAQEGAIPVLSCEGACIRGEIARLAANRVAQAPGYRRGCHGELFAVPDSAIAKWVRGAGEVVIIDGCPLKCHGRIAEHLVAPGRLRTFDAFARYRKFSDLFDIDAVPEPERRAIAEDVAEWVLGQLEKPAGAAAATTPSSCSKGGAAAASPDCASQPNGTDAGVDSTPSRFTLPVQALVGIGAAVAANCEPCLEYHVHNAEQHGISREDMRRAIAVGGRVKDAPHQKIVAAAERLTRIEPVKDAAPATACCAAPKR